MKEKASNINQKIFLPILINDNIYRFIEKKIDAFYFLDISQHTVFKMRIQIDLFIKRAWKCFEFTSFYFEVNVFFIKRFLFHRFWELK